MQEEEEEIGSPQVVNIDIDKQNKKKNYGGTQRL